MVLMYVSQDVELFTAATPQSTQAKEPPSAIRLPPAQHDMKPAIRMAIEYARIDREITLPELARITSIDADTLKAYEQGTVFPRADDIATLQMHLDTTFISP